MIGFRQINQLEVESKGPRQTIGLHQVQRMDAAQGRGKRLRRFGFWGCAFLSFAAANGDLAQFFHFGKELFVGLLTQDLAQQHAQGAHIAPQRRFFNVALTRLKFGQTQGPAFRFPEQSHCL